MTARAIRFRVYDTDGEPLSGVALAFDDAGAFYLVDGATPALPTVSAVTGAPGVYGFTATLDVGETLVARLSLGASSSVPWVDFDFTEAELRALPTAADTATAVRSELATELARLDVAVSSVEAPTAAEVAAEVDSVLSASHGAGAWGGAGGSGAESVTLTARSNGNSVQGAKVTIYNGGGTQVAQSTSGSAGGVTLALDPGVYVARAFLAGHHWPPTTIAVTATDTVSPTTLDGEALPGRLQTREGVSETCSLTAPAYDAEISGVTAGEDVTLTRTVLGVPDGAAIESAELRWGDANRQAGTLTATVAGATISFAATPTHTRAMRGPYSYQIAVTLSDGAVSVVESGRLRVKPEVP